MPAAITARATPICRKLRWDSLVPVSGLRRGDLIFWKGHVAIARDAQTMIHANAFHMAVAIEPIAEAVARIRDMGSEITQREAALATAPPRLRKRFPV